MGPFKISEFPFIVSMMTKQYGRAYFEKWYRSPRSRVISPAHLRRKVQMVVSIAEWFLRRPIRSVLDVGCGEGGWRRHIISLRPHVRYSGVDASDYVIRRFGRSRNIRKGTFGSLGELELNGTYDLIISSDVLHYVEDDEIERGLEALVRLADGLVFADMMTRDDGMRGDFEEFHARSAAWYRKRFVKAGLIPCGMQCYLAPAIADEAIALEVLPRL